MDTKKIIKFALCLLIAVVLRQTAQAQNNANLDDSPMDISYFRINNITAPIAKAVYGRPVKTTAKVFGEQVPFDKIWRTGANEATEIKFYQDVSFGGATIPAGTYVLYTIPSENEWEIILSSNLDVWGANQYDPFFDMAKVSVPVSKAEPIDHFSIGFKAQENGFDLVLRWDTTKIKVPVSIENTENYALSQK